MGRAIVMMAEEGFMGIFWRKEGQEIAKDTSFQLDGL